jgi:hypothetical protein
LSKAIEKWLWWYFETHQGCSSYHKLKVPGPKGKNDFKGGDMNTSMTLMLTVWCHLKTLLPILLTTPVVASVGPGRIGTAFSQLWGCDCLLNYKGCMNSFREQSERCCGNSAIRESPYLNNAQ